MVIPIVPLLVLVILAALFYYVINALVQDPTLKNIFTVVLVVFVVLGLLQIFGLLGGGTLVVR